MKLLSFSLYQTLFVPSQEWYWLSLNLSALLQSVTPNILRLFAVIFSSFLLMDVAATTLLFAFKMQKLFVCIFVRIFSTTSFDCVMYCRLFNVFSLLSQKRTKSLSLSFNSFNASNFVLEAHSPFSQ